jgi:hypothetical protein
MQRQRLLALALCLVNAAANAQPGNAGGPPPPPPPPPVETAIREQWRRGAEFPPLSDLVINWRHDNSFVPPDAQLDSLRAEVKENPAHARAAELSEYERRIREGTPLVRTFSLRARGPEEWRLCQNARPGDGEVEFIDYVLSPSLAWKLTPNWLVLIDPARPMPAGHPIRDVGLYFTHDLFMILDGGVRNAALVHAELRSITQTADGWRATATDSGGVVGREFHWRWDAAAGRPFVKRLIITKGGDEPGTFWEFHDWTLQSEGPIWIASRAEKYAPSGKLSGVVTLEGVAREEPDRFAKVVAAPDFGIPDSLRGSIEFRSITDYRGDPPIEIIQTKAGIQRIPLTLAAQVAEQGEQDYRRLGWGLAGLAVVVLVFVRLCRKRDAGAQLSLSPSMEKAL